MKWRIYRLPGSRKVWHVDAGPGTAVINVFSWGTNGVPARSVDMGCYPIPGQVPFVRAYIEVEGELLVSPQMEATFYSSDAMRCGKAE